MSFSLSMGYDFTTQPKLVSNSRFPTPHPSKQDYQIVPLCQAIYSHSNCSSLKASCAQSTILCMLSPSYTLPNRMLAYYRQEKEGQSNSFSALLTCWNAASNHHKLDHSCTTEAYSPQFWALNFRSTCSFVPAKVSGPQSLPTFFTISSHNGEGKANCLASLL